MPQVAPLLALPTVLLAIGTLVSLEGFFTENVRRGPGRTLELSYSRFLTRHQIGRIAPKEPEACLEAIARLLADDAALARMGRNMRRLKGQLEVQSLERLMAALAVDAGKEAL